MGAKVQSAGKWLLLITLILLAGGLYGFTMAPTITWFNQGADSGELASVVATLGIAHPPGYPTYTLLGFLWSFLPLGGDVAYRLNWLSGVSTIIAMITMILVTEALTRSPAQRLLSKISGGIVFAAAPLVWSQSVITEVYAPGLGFLGLITLSYVRLLACPTKPKALLTGLLIGLSLGVLPSLGVLVPVVLGGLFYKANNKTRFAGLALSMGLGLLVGLLPFAYLPLRAAAKPPLNWGAPSTWASFWELVTASQYHHLAGIPGWTIGLQRFLGGTVVTPKSWTQKCRCLF